MKRCRRSEGNADLESCEGATLDLPDDDDVEKAIDEALTVAPGWKKWLTCAKCGHRLVFFKPFEPPTLH